MKKIYLIRHGETEWTLSGQHTGSTDIPLTEKGIKQAESLAKRLKGHHFKAVLSSPRQRALHTCEIAGLAQNVHVDPKLAEWNYGSYEGLTSKQIHVHDPKWNIFHNGGPGGESVLDIQKRCDAVLKEIASIAGDVAIFSHGHFLRALTMRFIDVALIKGNQFLLVPASLSILSIAHDVSALSLWNDISHLYGIMY